MITTLMMTLALGAAQSPAADRHLAFSGDYQACVARDPSNANVSHCQAEELALQTARVDGMVEAVAAELSENQGRLMLRLKAGWLEALNRRCEAEADGLEGAHYGRVFTECRIAGLVDLTTTFNLNAAG